MAPSRDQLSSSDFDDFTAPPGRRLCCRLSDALSSSSPDGLVVEVGAEVVLEITRECDPCERMEALADGLRAAMTPDWRGGACAMVISGGRIAVGDEIRMEEA